MAEKRDYFSNKLLLASRAREHVGYIDATYPEDTTYTISRTTVYGGPDYDFTANCDLDVLYHSVMSGTPLEEKYMSPAMRYALATVGNHTPDKLPKVILKDCTTGDAMYEEIENKKSSIVLNFASYKHPGGMFLEGSSAQEESLCHISNLYNVLVNLTEYYAWNNNNLNRGLYKDRAVYTPNIVFEKNYPFCADVVTCASPNWSAASKYGKVSYEENLKVLKDRIGFIFKVIGDNVELRRYCFNPNGEYNTGKTLILGAFGCGVFGQSAVDVGKIFAEYINEGWTDAFDSVVFAVPYGKNFVELGEGLSSSLSILTDGRT